MQYYLAVDIGASSGRHMLGHMENGKIILEEIHRFQNGLVKKDGELCWDVDSLFEEIKAGMRKCRELGKIPVSMGIDTWGVDFCLLDRNGHRIGNAVSYRDKRTVGADQLVYEIISEEELYAATGIQKQIFNTIYQLKAVQREHPEYLERAQRLLLIPDYFHYLLTGNAVTEYTNATTTQLINPITKEWDRTLIHKLGYPERIFCRIAQPGTCIGKLKKEIEEEVGFTCNVILPATHDTGSAVMAVPADEEDVLYISSGTWSLIGTERKAADCSQKSREHNFTNEGGYNSGFRYLKNIMGLWLIQNVRKEIAGDFDFATICRLASMADFPSRIDCNDNRFLAPRSMMEEIRSACRETGQLVPDGVGETAAVIYNSLAECYAEAVEELEQISGKKYRTIYVVGGGANADYLNRMTAKVSGRRVCAGPTEATAVGNLSAQMIAAGEVKDLRSARRCIAQSFAVKEFQ